MSRRPQNNEGFIEFFTATVVDWCFLLQTDTSKAILTDALYWLVAEGRCVVHALAIMDNHVHLLWKRKPGLPAAQVQGSFLRFSARSIMATLASDHIKPKGSKEVRSHERGNQFWQRDPHHLPIWLEPILIQKLNYIHHNPVTAGLAERPENYRWSSALFYQQGFDERFPFLTHYKDSAALD